MRKESREMSAEWAMGVLIKAPYVTVSMTEEDGPPMPFRCRWQGWAKCSISTVP